MTVSARQHPIHIIGVGNDGPESLSGRARQLIAGADLLCGGERLLEFFPGFRGERLAVKSNLRELATRLRGVKDGDRAVVLASGDPTFYGIARYLTSTLGKDRFEIWPNVSAMQWAFAKIKESWDDAAFISVHGRTMDGLCEFIAGHAKVGLFTDETNSPPAIARALLAAGLSGYRAFVCEDLCGPGERVTETDLTGLAAMNVSPLNTLILIREGGDPGRGSRSQAGRAVAECRPTSLETGGRTDQKLDEIAAPAGAWPSRHGIPAARAPLGLPEEAFYHRKPKKGLITKAEVRVLSLARMALGEASTVWDIGAGSGSVAIEAALLAPRGRVFAIEKNAEDLGLIRQNIAHFGVPHVTAIHGLAPAALEGLPDPDAVFIGGSGGSLREILEICVRRLRAGGRIVVNAVTIDTLHEATTVLRALGLTVEVRLVQVSRSKELLGRLAFEALNPIYVIVASRETS
jgi:precorrin-6Y C5,15-methyltransferase (decarboxylating)